MQTLVVLAAVLSLAAPACGISYSVCDTIGQEFVTAAPRLEGVWPYYNLLYTCTGNLNLEGFAVDACVLGGSKCGQAAADAFCQYLGFDFNSAGLYTVVPAKSPAISLTGEWCISPGEYEQLGHPNRTQFTTILEAYPGPYCASLGSVTCVKTRDSLRDGLAAVRRNAASSPGPAPASAPRPTQTANILANPSIISAGRRMTAAH